MPFVPVANTVMVELRAVFDGQQIENTLYFESTATADVGAMQVLASDLESWWSVDIAPLLPIDVTLNEIVVTDISSATGPQVTQAVPGGISGTLGQPALPNNVTMAISFRTALRGRSFRGRNYVMALTEGQVVNNTVSSGVVSAYAAAYNAINTLVAIPPGPYTWVVVSRFSGVDANGKPLPRPFGITTPVTGAVVVDPTVDSMRRRLPGRGR